MFLLCQRHSRVLRIQNLTLVRHRPTFAVCTFLGGGRWINKFKKRRRKFIIVVRKRKDVEE